MNNTSSNWKNEKLRSLEVDDGCEVNLDDTSENMTKSKVFQNYDLLTSERPVDFEQYDFKSEDLPRYSQIMSALTDLYFDVKIEKYNEKMTDLEDDAKIKAQKLELMSKNPSALTLI